ncbi:IniB N-terminal domain-containing protein [Actinomycetospora chiangmaiensis]|uniref:IniB N-terminal domain-containing protein n=1 Tax=Actinomycetospora chiangmaiensis TaxID=402650 RepID=UPI00039D468F|nr:IniB N-terminal domain-containing protein [Actinomycetospora chiangmaiensis]
MSEHKTLLEFLMDLLNNHDALAEFRDDPHAALQAAGLGNVCVDDIKELLPVVLEKVDAQKCAQYEDDCDDDKCWDSEPKHHDDHEHHCKPIDCDDEGRPAPHCSEIDKVVTHLNYVTNNYSYDSHDTIYNTTNVTKIWAGDGSDVNVTNETNNIGSHGVQVQGDSNAPIVTGDHSFVGDGNQMSGDGSTTAFGAGNATSLDHVGTGQNGVISTGSGTVNNSGAFGHGNQVAGANGVNTNTDSSNHDSGNTTLHTDSHNTDNSGSHNITDSQNHTTDSHDTDTSHSNNTTTDEQHNALVDASHGAVSPLLDVAHVGF